MLKVFLQTLPQRTGNLVEPDELSDTQQLRVVTGRARVETLNDCRNIAKYGRIHQSCGGNK